MTAMDSCGQAWEAFDVTLRERWNCTALPDGRLLLVFPLTYSDGDHPEMLVTYSDGDIVTVTDFGSTLQRLSLDDISLETPKLDPAILAICNGYGVYMEDGEVRADGRGKDLGVLVAQVAAAMLQLDALSVLRPDQRRMRFSTRLNRWLAASVPGRVQTDVPIVGRTGKRWRVTAVVHTEQRPVFVHAVSRGGDGRSVDHVYRVFSEAHHQSDNVGQLAVLAEAPSSYDAADLRSLAEVAAVGSWSERDRMVPFFESAQMPSKGPLFSGQMAIAVTPRPAPRRR